MPAGVSRPRPLVRTVEPLPPAKPARWRCLVRACATAGSAAVGVAGGSGGGGSGGGKGGGAGVLGDPKMHILRFLSLGHVTPYPAAAGISSHLRRRLIQGRPATAATTAAHAPAIHPASIQASVAHPGPMAAIMRHPKAGRCRRREHQQH